MTRAEENKLIERTAKHDAYQAVVMWAKDGRAADHGDALWYAIQKMENHLPFLQRHEFRYDYATSQFLPNDGYYEPRESQKETEE